MRQTDTVFCNSCGSLYQPQFSSLDPTLSLRLPQVSSFIVQLVELLSTTPELFHNFAKLQIYVL